MEHAVIDPVTYVGSILIALLAGIGSGFFLHVYSNKSIKKGLARILCTELQANHGMIRALARRNLSAPVEISDDVYRGLLSSGNMRYLARHQMGLYDLYASMRRNDQDVMDKISRQMAMLRTSL